MTLVTPGLMEPQPRDFHDRSATPLASISEPQFPHPNKERDKLMCPPGTDETGTDSVTAEPFANSQGSAGNLGDHASSDPSSQDRSRRGQMTRKTSGQSKCLRPSPGLQEARPPHSLTEEHRSLTDQPSPPVLKRKPADFPSSLTDHQLLPSIRPAPNPSTAFLRCTARWVLSPLISKEERTAGLES